MSNDILDVDLLRFEQGTQANRDAVVDGVMRSLETGFVATSHDVPEEVIDAAYEMLARFYNLPTETKQRWAAPKSMGQAGYTGLLVETAAISETPDFKEMLNWGSLVPDGHPLRRKYPHRYFDPVFPEADVPGIGDVLTLFHERMLDLQRRFLRVIAVGLGCDEHFFDTQLEGSPALSRSIRYPAMAEAPGDAHVWAAEHGDINLITALVRATAPGLQVKTADGWIDAVAPDQHALINTGFMLERVSNGRIPTGWHRVVAAPGETGERYSVVQFCHPSPWTILAPLASCITPDRPQQFAPIEAGDMLDQVLYDINLVEDARRV